MLQDCEQLGAELGWANHVLAAKSEAEGHVWQVWPTTESLRLQHRGLRFTWGLQRATGHFLAVDEAGRTGPQKTNVQDPPWGCSLTINITGLSLCLNTATELLPEGHPHL